MNLAAIIPAAGQSTRMGGVDKILLEIAGRSVLEHSIRGLLASDAVSELIVAAGPVNRAKIHALIHRLQPEYGVPITTVDGGPTRLTSVRNAVAALMGNAYAVMVHDAARPLVSLDVIHRAISDVTAHGAVIAGIPVVDTIKEVDSDGTIRRTVPRDDLRAVQTPQLFRLDWLQACYRILDQTEGLDFTDEAGLLEYAGYPVHVFAGDPQNIKLTIPEDIAFIEMVLQSRRSRGRS